MFLEKEKKKKSHPHNECSADLLAPIIREGFEQNKKERFLLFIYFLLDRCIWWQDIISQEIHAQANDSEVMRPILPEISSIYMLTSITTTHFSGSSKQMKMDKTTTNKALQHFFFSYTINDNIYQIRYYKLFFWERVREKVNKTKILRLNWGKGVFFGGQGM